MSYVLGRKTIFVKPGNRNTTIARSKRDRQKKEKQERQRDPSNPWRWDPLPLAEFIEHPEHLSATGKISLWPQQKADLELFLGTDPKKLFEGSTGYVDAFFIWGKGSGKDFCCSCVQAWVAHVLLCLWDPQEYLEQAPNENLDIVNVAYNQDQARNVYFTKFLARIRNWPWLRWALDQLEPEIGADRWLREGAGYVGVDYLHLPHTLSCWALPSTLGSLEGKNLIFWVADEIAAFQSPNKISTAHKIYGILRSSATTRFVNRWKGFAITYPRHKGDIAMKTWEAKQAGRLEHTLVTKRATWEVNPKVTKENFAEDYRTDPETSKTQYECDPPATIDAYFRSPELITLHANGCPVDLLGRYFEGSPEELEQVGSLRLDPILEVDDFSDPILDEYGFPRLRRDFRGRRDPNGDPYDYWIHVDPGVTRDSAGFAMSHVELLADGSYMPTLDLVFRWTANHFRDFGVIKRRGWFRDTLDSTETVVAGEIDFRTIREFIFYLRFARGFEIRQVTYDHYQSVESIQEMRKRGISAGQRNTTTEDYGELKTLIYQRQLNYYGWPILIRELEKLQLHNGIRVEAPRTSEGAGPHSDSHKETSDCVASLAKQMVSDLGSGVELATIELPQPRHLKPGSIPEYPAMDPDALNESQKQIWAEFFEAN